MPGQFVRNGNKFYHSPTNGFYAIEDEDKTQLEVCMLFKSKSGLKFNICSIY